MGSDLVKTPPRGHYSFGRFGHGPGIDDHRHAKLPLL